MTDGADVTQYAYDTADRLSGVTLADGTTVAYSYDAAGRRVRQSVAAQVTNYLWDETSPYGDVVLETDGGGSMLASYVLGGTELLSQTRGGVMSYYLHDGQGSTRALSDVSGAVTDTYAYTAFGDLYAQTGSTANVYLYTGQQFDSLTGLYSLRARYYVPAIGRFLSRDIEFLDVNDPNEYNRYKYVSSDPINAIDPKGSQAFVEYESIQSNNERRTLNAFAETERAALEAKEAGRTFAIESRQIATELRAELTRLYGPRQASTYMSRITVGATKIGGQNIVAVNGGAPADVIRILESWYPEKFVSSMGNAHVERFLYETAVRFSTNTGLPMSEVIQAIGIANVNGPCPLCLPLVNEIPIFFLGRLLPYLI